MNAHERKQTLANRALTLYDAINTEREAAWVRAGQEANDPEYTRLTDLHFRSMCILRLLEADAKAAPIRRPTSGPEYDAAQTALCDRLRERLQSIAILAVRAQDLDPSGDALMDMLSDIESDVQAAQSFNTRLVNNDVFDREG